MSEGTWRDSGWAPPSPFLWVGWLLIGADPARWNGAKPKDRRKLARQTDELASHLTDDPAAYQFPRRPGFLGDEDQIENADARGYVGSVLEALSPESAAEANAAVPDALARRGWFQYLGGSRPDTPPAHAAAGGPGRSRSTAGATAPPQVSPRARL